MVWISDSPASYGYFAYQAVSGKLLLFLWLCLGAVWGWRAPGRSDGFPRGRGTWMLYGDRSRKETRLESKHHLLLAAGLMRKVMFLLSRAEKTNITPSSCLQRRKLPAPCFLPTVGRRTRRDGYLVYLAHRFMSAGD